MQGLQVLDRITAAAKYADSETDELLPLCAITY